MLNPLRQISIFLGGVLTPSSAAQRRLTYLRALQVRDYDTALPLIEAAVRFEDPIAMACLGLYYQSGLGSCAKDQESATAWYRQAAVRGNAQGQCALGLQLATGAGTALDNEEAAYWLYKAACQGAPVAVDALGQLVHETPALIGKYFSESELRRLIKESRTDDPPDDLL